MAETDTSQQTDTAPMGLGGAEAAPAPLDLDAILAPFATAGWEDWRARVAAVLKGADFDASLVSRSRDGFAIGPLAPPATGEAADAALQGRTGGRPWRILQRLDHPEPAAAAEQARDDVAGGADGLTLVFSGARAARGFGLPIAAPDALEEALADIAIETLTLRLDAGPDGLEAAQRLIGLAERRHLDLTTLDIDLGLDASGIAAWCGGDGAALTPGMGRFVADLAARGFQGRPLLADGRPWHEAGGTDAQELAVVLASGVAKLRVLSDHGFDLDSARARIAFLLVSDVDLYASLAKMRAMRRLWARVEHACGLTPRPIRLHCETAWRMMTRRDPWSNLLRTAIATLAAGLGGADSVLALPFTAALGVPDGFARRLARNLGPLMIEEANLARVTDPAAGSGTLETLTGDLEHAAWAQFQEIEREGGLLASLKSGALAERLARSRAMLEADAAAGRLALVGSNLFAQAEEPAVAVILPAPAVEVAADALPSIRLSAAFETAILAPENAAENVR